MSARVNGPKPWMLGVALLSGLNLCAAAWAQEAAPTPITPADIQAGKDTAFTLVDSEADNKDVFTFDFGVPSSPALTLLDVNKDNVTQSNSLKPFVLALPGLFSSQGTGQTVALDVAPAWLATTAGQRANVDYTGSRPLWFRTRVGVAVYEGVNDADPAKQKPSRIAFGISSSLLNSSDPILASAPGQSGSAWKACYKSGRDVVRNSMPVPGLDLTSIMSSYDAHDKVVRALEKKQRSGSLTEQEQSELEANRALRVTDGKAYDAKWVEWQTTVAPAFAKSEGANVINGCLKVADRAARTGADLDVGGGAALDGDPGKLSGLGHPTAVFWASFRTSLGVSRPRGNGYQALIDWAKDNSKWLMVGGSGRIGISENIATGDTAKPIVRANTYAGWIGIERYSDVSRFTAQIGARRVDPRAAADSGFAGTQTVYLAAFDQKVTDTIWLTISYGKASGAGALKDDSTARVSLTFDTPGVRKIFGD